MSGVLPDWDNLSEFASGAEYIESLIGRRLEIVSGGSSITLTLIAAGKPIPEKINHLRIGGAIANPMGIRRNRGVEIEGMRRRAIVALGSQDIGDPKQLVPLDSGVEVVGGSSDHTVLDVTDSEKNFRPGDVVRFRAYYMPLLYCFSTRHVSKYY